MTDSATLFTRHPGNPLLCAERWPYATGAVMNAGATLVGDDTLLLCRVEDRRGFSHLTCARSRDGASGWIVDDRPALAFDGVHLEEEWGLEDETFERLGIAMAPEDRNAVLLPRRVGGDWTLFHRPGTAADVWVSRSADLERWREPELVLSRRHGGWWDSARVGMGPPPLETEHGWLVVYHGVRETVAGGLYRAGLALLDLDQPAVVLRRSEEWVLGPGAGYERAGDLPNAVLPCGLVHHADTDELFLYYGAADTSIGLATAGRADVLDYLLTCPPG